MKRLWAILVVALVAGALLRFPRMDLRPMHTDEAVHAIKFGALLEQGTYRYDKKEYHGPTLNYFTLVPALLFSEKTLAQVNETTLRIVPAFFGLFLILLVLLVADIGRAPSAIAALLTACSPAMVFYSRYYIQETLLVFFAFGLIGTAYRRATGGREAWSAFAGICAGLMFATKETWLISCGVMGLAYLGLMIFRHHDARRGVPVSVRSLATALVCGVAVSILFYSSFFTHWQGVRDSILTYETYFTRAGEGSRHGHPWYYFLQTLLWSKGEHGPVWTEAGIVLFGLAGVWNAFKGKGSLPERGRDLQFFFGLYALLMLVVLSAIPYKTPWLMLGVLQPLIVMAGCGVSTFLNWLDARKLRGLGVFVVAVMICHLAWQAYLANFTYYDDPVNPYVYSQPTDDVRRIADVVQNVVRRTPGGVSVQVICEGDDYWPLPWYFRSVANVGWWNAVSEGFVPTGLMLASPDMEPALLRRIYEWPPPGQKQLYVPLFESPVFLRPGRELRGYITLDLWNTTRKEKEG